MGIRNYTNTGQTSTLSAAIGATDTTATLVGYAGDPSPPFTAAFARGTATEEVVLVTGVSGSTVTVTRGYDGTAAQAQGAGSTFQEVVVAQDFREANGHVNATGGAHGITGGFVGTTDTQTLTNKTLTSPTLTGATLNGTTAAATVNVVTLTVSGVTTLANVSVTGTVTFSGGLTVPTGHTATLTDAPSAGTDAANKAYVDGKTWPSSAISDATSSPTANTAIKRDAAGRAQVATPSATGDIATKGYADAVGTSAATASQVVKRDANGRAQVADPAVAADIATKNYVDTATALVYGKAWGTSGISAAVANATVATVAFNASRLSGGVTFGSNKLTLPQDGFYEITYKGYATGAQTGAVAWNVYRTRASVADVLCDEIQFHKASTGSDEAATGSTIVPLKASDAVYLQIGVANASGGISYVAGNEAQTLLQVRYIAPLNGATPI